MRNFLTESILTMQPTEIARLDAGELERLEAAINTRYPRPSSIDVAILLAHVRQARQRLAERGVDIARRGVRSERLVPPVRA